MPHKYGKRTGQRGKGNITKSARFFFMVIFDETIIPLAFIEYKIIIANLNPQWGVHLIGGTFMVTYHK